MLKTKKRAIFCKVLDTIRTFLWGYSLPAPSSSSVCGGLFKQLYVFHYTDINCNIPSLTMQGFFKLRSTILILRESQQRNCFVGEGAKINVISQFFERLKNQFVLLSKQRNRFEGILAPSVMIRICYQKHIILYKVFMQTLNGIYIVYIGIYINGCHFITT